MNYRRLGSSGVKVSEISLGSWISCDDLSTREASFKKGADPLNIKIMENLKNLRRFVESFDFIKMRRDRDLLVAMKIPGSFNCISERGKQYAVYIHHSWPNNGQFGKTYYTPAFGDYYAEVTLAMEKGEYIVEWVEPETLRVLITREIVHESGHMILEGPEYNLDMALRIKTKNGG